MVRVLIVDDHLLFAEALEAILSLDRRIQVVGRAGDGEQAVEIVRELQPDVVLMDLSMPRRRLRRHARDPRRARAGPHPRPHRLGGHDRRRPRAGGRRRRLPHEGPDRRRPRPGDSGSRRAGAATLPGCSPRSP
jgi:hypothetical protein